MDDVDRSRPGQPPTDAPRTRRDEFLRARGLEDVDRDDTVAASEVGADDDPADLGDDAVDDGTDSTGS